MEITVNDLTVYDEFIFPEDNDPIKNPWYTINEDPEIIASLSESKSENKEETVSIGW